MISPQHSHLDLRLLLVVVQVLADQQTEDHLTYTTAQKMADQVVVEVDIPTRPKVMVTYIHHLLLFILRPHLDKEMMVEQTPEDLLILVLVVVDQVQLDKPTPHQLVVMADRELNYPPHSEIQLLV